MIDTLIHYSLIVLFFYCCARAAMLIIESEIDKHDSSDT